LDRQRLLAASLGIAVFLIPLYPAFITLTGAPVPGIAVVPRPLTVGLLAVCAALALLWIAALVRGPRRPEPTVLALAAFPGAALLAALLGFDPAAGALFVAILAGGVLWHAAVLNFARDEASLRVVFGAFLLSGALAALAAIGMVIAKTPVALYTIGHGRATGTFVLPGELAGYLIVYVPVAFALARSVPALRPLALAGLAAGGVAFAMTFSRAGFVGMAAAIAAFVLMRRRRRGAQYAVAIAGAAVVVIGLAFNAHHDPSENFTRLSIWDAAVRMARDFPISGVGPFAFPRVYAVLRDAGGEPLAFHAHNVVLTIAAETGLVGLAAVLYGWLRFAAELRRRLRTPSQLDRVAAAIAAGLIGTWAQGTIDTSSVVIFALWLPFAALALVCAGDAREPQPQAASPLQPVRVAAIATIVLVCAVCSFVQVASDAIYAPVAAPGSVVARLGTLGARPYAAIERIARLPFIEAALATYALDHGDLRAASARAMRLPNGPERSDLLGRIAERRGDQAPAIREYLDAGDDEALQRIVYALVRADRLADARGLERRVLDRLLALGLRPNDVADAWWRLGVIESRQRDLTGAGRAFYAAVQAAPLNTKYRLYDGMNALFLGQFERASASFEAIVSIDPADADAVAGLGMIALERGDRAAAARYSARANATNDRATVAAVLSEALGHGANVSALRDRDYSAHDPLAPPRTARE
jgi:O-antigen ligase/tetratricopeptide (TPR) repeat protein